MASRLVKVCGALKKVVYSVKAVNACKKSRLVTNEAVFFKTVR